MRFALILAVLTAGALTDPRSVFHSEKPVDFTGYELISVQASNENDIANIDKLSEQFQLDKWNVFPIDGRILLMAPPLESSAVRDALTAAGLDPKLVHANIQEMIDIENAPSNNSRLRASDGAFVFNEYQTLQQIGSGIEYYSRTYDHVEKLSMNGLSHQNKTILGARIATGEPGKKIVFFECGAHGNEWITVSLCNYLIHELAANAEKYKDILDVYEFHIYPSVNPDGFDHTRTHNRMWRKNMKPNGGRCIGTDLNRNFHVGQFCGIGATKNGCQNMFCGTGPFSEPEARAIRDTVLPLQHRIDTYISVHAFGQLWMFPYAANDNLCSHHENLTRKATAGAKAIENFAPSGSPKTVYRVGTFGRAMYKAAGTSIDWVYEKTGIKNVYILELTKHRNGMIFPKELVLSTCQETMIGIQAMLLA